MISEKEEITDPEFKKGPLFTLVLNGSPENIIKDSISPTALSYLGILRSFPPIHIINTHANQLTVTALSVMYIGARLLENGGYALSVVRNTTQESIQERIIKRRTAHEPQCRCVSTCLDWHSWSWKELFEPKSFVLMTPMTFLALCIIPEWMEKYGAPEIVFFDNLNAYPPSIRGIFHPLIRSMLWDDPTIQVIISDSTVSNTTEIATLFFGNEGDYVHIK